MQARSALFDLYGDHLRPRGGAAPVAAVVRLLDPVGIGAPAVRTAISRMVKDGWLEPVQTGNGRGWYRTTERANRRIDATTERIYRRDGRRWDGHWHLVLLSAAGRRSTRTRLRADLRFLGYAELGDEVWVSPFASRELTAALERSGATARTARADHVDPTPTTAWDLEGLRAAYRGWLSSAERMVDDRLAEGADPDRAAFAARFELVHEWRKFLFADPGLPDELLPAEWPGRAAGALFTDLADWLRPGSDRFVARCLGD